MKLYDKIMKQSNYDCFKIKFIILYLLNVTDILFTLFLLDTGLFTEGNFFINKMLSNKQLTLCFKIFIPALLLFYVYLRMANASEKQLKFANELVKICIIFYFVINITHVIWTCTFLFYSLT